MSGWRATGRMLFALGGLILWAGHFTAVYGFTSLACARGFAAITVAGLDLVAVTIVLLTVLALAAAALVLRAAVRPAAPALLRDTAPANARLLRHLAAGGVALGSIAILWQAAPALLLPACT